MIFSELRHRMQFWETTDRLGPDIPLTHWRLYFKSTMLRFCKKKFKYFSDTAEIRPGAYIVGCKGISIGSRVIIRPGCMLHANPSRPDIGITIEDDVMMGSGVHFYIDKHNFDNPDVPIIYQGDAEPQAVVIKKGCWLGANVIILPGVTVGENAVVGAGSVVTRSVLPNTLVAGNPARLVREIRKQANENC